MFRGKHAVAPVKVDTSHSSSNGFGDDDDNYSTTGQHPSQLERRWTQEGLYWLAVIDLERYINHNPLKKKHLQVEVESAVLDEAAVQTIA
jgi:hypothetical protein